MAVAAGVRIGWAELPTEVRSGVEEILGGAVVEAVSQVDGFSPGTADWVRTSDGRRGFVKAVSAAQNERTPDMHRREAMARGAELGDVRRCCVTHGERYGVQARCVEVDDAHRDHPLWIGPEARRLGGRADHHGGRSALVPGK